MQREKSKRKNRKDQNTDTECRGGTTCSSDESSQWRGSEGVVLSCSEYGSTGRDESMSGKKPYEIPNIFIDWITGAVCVERRTYGSEGGLG